MAAYYHTSPLGAVGDTNSDLNFPTSNFRPRQGEHLSCVLHKSQIYEV